MATTKVSLKLLIDRRSKKVLFAEARKDFVDFLFNLLALPVGTVIRLLTKNSMVGSLGNLYGSIDELSNTYLQSTYTKYSLLRPKPSASAAQVCLLPADSRGNVATPTQFYLCSQNFHSCNSNHMSTVSGIGCPKCRHAMTREMNYDVGQEKNKVKTDNPNGFVKGVVTYMVMDNLVVKPMSNISSITMLTKFNVKDVGLLEEKVVDLDMAQGLNLLKASLHSETVLTSVFLSLMPSSSKGLRVVLLHVLFQNKIKLMVCGFVSLGFVCFVTSILPSS